MRKMARCAVMIALISSAPVAAMPNVFWTFGYHLPVERARAPRFGWVSPPTIRRDSDPMMLADRLPVIAQVAPAGDEQVASAIAAAATGSNQDFHAAPR